MAMEWEGMPLMTVPLNTNLPLESSIHPRDEIEQSRLAGTIRPDHSENRSFPNLKVHTLQSLETPESLVNAPAFQR